MGSGGSYSASMLLGNTSYINSLRSYQQTNSLQIYSDALDMANTSVAPVLMDVTMQSTEAHLMLQHFDAAMPSTVTNPMWQSFGVLHTGDPVANANSLYSAATTNGTLPLIPAQMVNAIMTDEANGNDNADVFYDAFIADDNIFLSPNLHNGPFQADLANVLYTFGNMPVLYTFFDQWSPAQSVLNASTPVNTRLSTVYSSDIAGTVNDYTTNVAGDAADRAISEIPGITTGVYYGLASAVVGTSTLGSLYTYGVVNDSFALAEHHIYGSSRLGVQRYDTVGHRDSWNFNGGSPAMGVSDLNTPKPWYSYSYDDLIDTTYTTTYGHGDVTKFSTSRTVGLRNYEMTDYLGNVLATVLDRKYGHLPSGGTSYDYWNPSLSTVQDYYPGGMLMPGRYLEMNGDTNTYRFSHQGSMKDNEVYGYGNFSNLGDRPMDNRLNWLPSPDPLFKKFSGQSPYTYAGDNPIWMFDRKGQKKTVYNVTIMENTGKVLIQKITSPGLLANSYTSFYSGITTYDWYDYSVINTITIGKDGRITTSSTAPIRGDLKTNTLLKSETWAEAKRHEIGFNLEPSKDLSEHDGFILTSKHALFPGNDHELNANGRGEIINMDELSPVISMAAWASSVETPANVAQAMKYAWDAARAAHEAQDMAPIRPKHDTANCDVPGGCGQLHVIDANGNTNIGIPYPKGKSAKDYSNP
ncbi:MAG: hypothetical protein H0X33_14385 [Taibaiella sp.]|nr:hypothetical protein [Taibaiella sp.]